MEYSKLEFHLQMKNSVIIFFDCYVDRQACVLTNLFVMRSTYVLNQLSGGLSTLKIMFMMVIGLSTSFSTTKFLNNNNQASIYMIYH